MLFECVLFTSVKWQPGKKNSPHLWGSSPQTNAKVLWMVANSIQRTTVQKAWRMMICKIQTVASHSCKVVRVDFATTAWVQGAPVTKGFGASGSVRTVRMLQHFSGGSAAETYAGYEGGRPYRGWWRNPTHHLRNHG